MAGFSDVEVRALDCDLREKQDPHATCKILGFGPGGEGHEETRKIYSVR